MVGQGPTPGYTFHYFYHSIDITDFLNEGRNIIAIHAYYQGMINRVWVNGDNRHGIICDIVDENDNILFCTDESTLCHRYTGYSDAGKCGYGTQFLEAYDAGATEYDFFAETFDDSSWANASLMPDADDYCLFPSPLPLLTLEEIKPAQTMFPFSNPTN